MVEFLWFELIVIQITWLHEIMISEIIYHHYKYIQKVMLFIVILSTDILECEEFNPPVDSSDELTEASTIPTIEETDAESTIGSTIDELPTQPTTDESTIEGPTPHSVEQADQTLTFQIMEGASERGKRKLIDSCGFSYNVKRQRLHSTDWQCRNLFHFWPWPRSLHFRRFSCEYILKPKFKKSVFSVIGDVKTKSSNFNF